MFLPSAARGALCCSVRVRGYRGERMSHQATIAPAGRSRLGSRWVAPLVLAVPFLVMIAVLRGMTVTLPIFHSTDEGNYIYPTILQFSHGLPFPSLHHYVAAQTPLFPLLEAYVGKLIGYALWRLRLVEVAISYLLALAVYQLLRRRLGLERLAALALALLFVLSPYVFGTSFRVITDNLATLFIVVAVDRFERSRETGAIAPYAVGCAALAAAMFTRQSAAFLLAVAGLYALRAAPTLLRRAELLGTAALSVIPVGLLFLAWHGLVPPGGDPSSCALCGSCRDVGAHEGTLVVQTPELTLATFGLYGVVLFAPALVLLGRDALGRSPRELLRRASMPLLGALAGAVLLLAFPAQPGTHTAGVLWNAAGRLPSVAGSSLLFWALVPLAGALIVWRARAGRRNWLFFAFFASFLLGALAIRYPWQKYVDPFALLALYFTVRRDDFTSARALAGAGVLAAAFVAYAVSFAA
jgi:4-amino-4-deoxy-L-arabinose transferase-like glycosyltransferase